MLEINGQVVRYASKFDVLDVLKSTKKILRLVVIAGGLKAPPLPHTGHKMESRYQKAKVFHSKVSNEG